MIKTDEKSVYELITDLCINLTPDRDVKKQRIRAYETLLKKGFHSENYGKGDDGEESENEVDPIHLLHLHEFEMRFKATTVEEELKCEEFSSFIDEIRNEGNDFFKDETNRAVVTLLTALRNSNPASDVQNRHRPQTFPTSLEINLTDNPYYLNLSGTLETGFFKLGITPTDCFSPHSPADKSPVLIKLSDDLRSIPKTFERHSNLSQKQDVTTNSDDEDEETNVPRVYNQNWESLGHKTVPVEKSFASEVPSSYLHLRSMRNRQQYVVDDTIRIATIGNFMRCLKLMTIGIESDIFRWDTSKSIFRLVEGCTITDVSPETVSTTVSELIETGTCFKRLQRLINQNAFTRQHIVSGFVFRSVCNSIEVFLKLVTHFVQSFHDDALLEFKHRNASVFEQIVALGMLFGIHPSSRSDFLLPFGSNFLDYLYKRLMVTTKPDVEMLLISLLSQCCQSYFKQLEKWMFGGCLYDESKELFIYHVDTYRPNTKAFFDKAYLIGKSSVPEFLKGFEEEILLCGKYTMLLKAFKPTHPIFTSQPLQLTLCLSHTKVNLVKETCRRYLTNAMEICGPMASIQKLFEDRRAAKLQLFSVMHEKYRENLERWRDEQVARAAEVNVEKQKRLNELKQQIEDNREQKLAAKMANIELEKYYVQIGIENEEKQIAQEQLEIQKRISYYEELNQIIDERKARADEEITRLKSLDLKPLPIVIDDVMAMSQTSDHLKTPEESIFKSLQVDIPSTNNTETHVEVIIDVPSPTTKSPTLPRSKSDLFNANVAADEFHRNKQKILASNIHERDEDDTRKTPAEINRAKVLREEFDYYQDCDNVLVNESEVDRNLNELTDAQKNKIKVLGHEFGIDVIGPRSREVDNSDLSRNRTRNEKHFEHDDDDDIVIGRGDRRPSDWELNKIRCMGSDINREQDEDVTRPVNRVPSDRELNKLRVMGTDINGPAVEITLTPSQDKSLMSDLQRNRMKVMNQEFDLFREFNAPEIKPQLNLNLDRVRNRQKCLESEYNILTGSSTTPIIDGSRSIKDFHELKKFGIPDTAVLNEPTPESAMISKKDGFRFPVPAIHSDDIIPDLSIVVEQPSMDDVDNPYAMKVTESKYFQLTPKMKENDKMDVVSEKYMTSPSLTKFLQMSIAIPLNAHLEIMNSEILKIFLYDLNIFDHFSTLRKCFLLMDGEFGSLICEGLISRIQNDSRPQELLNYQMLHLLIENSMASSTVGQDKNSDRISFDVDEIPEKFDLLSPNVLSMLKLSYRVEWPLNLILNPESLGQYANIFRYLIKVRRVSWILEEVFHSLKVAVKEKPQILYSRQYTFVQEIRHKLTHFIMTLQNHITSNALQAAWKIFKNELVTVKTMEELYRRHTGYIKRILFLCMLNKKSQEFHNTIEDIFKVILRFCYRLKSRAWTKVDGDLDYSHSKFNKMRQDDRDFEKLIRYTIYLGKKIVKHGYQEEIENFIGLLNINGYYDIEKKG